MTAVQRRRRTTRLTAAAMAAPFLAPHILRGDGLWLLTVATVGVLVVRAAVPSRPVQ